MKTVLSVIVKTLLGLLVGVLLLLTLVVLIGQHPKGAEWLLAQALPLRATASVDSPLLLERAGGKFPQDLQLEGLTLRDAEGVWLRAERLRMRWKPLSLLMGKLHLELLQGAGVAVERAPLVDNDQPPPPPSTGPPQLPSLPIAILLDQLQIDQLSLGAPLLGEAMQLQVDGSLAFHNQRQLESRLNVLRTDLQGERYHLGVAWRDGRELSSEIELSAPQGGLLPRLMALPDYPALQFKLAGDGVLADWRANLSGDVEDWGALNGEISADLRQPLQLQLQLRAQAGKQIPADIRRLLGKAPTLQLEAGYSWNGPLRVRQLKLESQVGQLEAHAQLSAEGVLSNSEAALDLRQPQLLKPWLGALSLARLQLQADIRGALAEPEVRLDLRADQLALKGVLHSDQLSGQASTQIGQFDPIRLQLNSQGTRFEQPSLQALLGGELSLAADAKLADEQLWLNQLSLKGRELELQGEAQSRLDFTHADASLRARLNSIREMSQSVAFDATGALALQLNAQLRQQNYRADLNADLQQLALAEPALQQILGDEVRLALAAEGNFAGQVKLSELQLNGQALALSGSAAFTPEQEQLAADLQLALPNLSPLAKQLRGGTRLKASLRGPLQQSRLQLTLEGDQLVWQENRFQPLTLQADIRRPFGAAEGELKLDSDGTLGPMTLSTLLARAESGALSLNDLLLTTEGNRLVGDLHLAAAGLPIEGQIDLTLTSLKPLQPLLPEQAELLGKSEMSLNLSVEQEQQNAQLQLKSGGLRLAGNQLGPLTLETALQDLLGEPQLALSLRGAEIESGPLQAGEISLTGDGRYPNFQLHGDLQGDLPGRAEISLSSRIQLAELATKITLDRLEGTLDQQPLKLRQPFSINLAEGVVSDSLKLQVGEGEIQAKLQLPPDGLQLQARLSDLPLQLVKLVSPDMPLSGQLNGQADLISGPGQSRASLNLQLNGIHLEDSPELSARMVAQWNGQQLKARAFARGFSDQPARIRVTLPLVTGGERHLPQLQANAPLDLGVDWQGQIAPIWALLPLPEHRLQGTAQLKLTVAGTLDRPQANGWLEMKQGEYEHLTQGALLEQIALRVDLEEAKRLQLNFSASDGEGGRLSASGQIGLAAAEPSKVSVAIRDALLIRRDQLRLQASGDLVFSGVDDQFLLEGKLAGDSLLISLEQQLPPSVVDLEVIEVSSNGKPTVEETSAKESRIALNLLLDLPRRVYVRGRGLESEWGGRLEVKGRAKAPRISGQLRVLRGDFTFVGRQFDFNRGVITFYGEDEIDPELDFALSYKGASMTTNFLLSGLASRPELSLSSSDPNVPEDEVLSKMLFDKGTTDLTPLEALELAQAVAELSGLLQGGGGGGISVGSVLAKIRDTLGVDVLRIRSGATPEEGATIDVGKYLTDGVYVGVRQGAQPEESEVTLEIELSDTVTFESSVGQANDNRSSINWEWDY